MTNRSIAGHRVGKGVGHQTMSQAVEGVAVSPRRLELRQIQGPKGVVGVRLQVPPHFL